MHRQWFSGETFALATFVDKICHECCLVNIIMPFILMYSSIMAVTLKLQSF